MDRRQFLVGLGAAALAGPALAQEALIAPSFSMKAIAEYVVTDSDILRLDILHGSFVPKPEWPVLIPYAMD
jgi:hypothetical protein